jgi:hypothetical protein
MKIAEKYRMGAILSYALLIITLIILFIAIWNRLALNPSVTISNALYFLLLATGILATAILVFFLMFTSTVTYQQEAGETGMEEDHLPPAPEIKTESFTAPFEVDVDVIADKIIPRIDPKETLNNYTERILINLAREFGFTQGIFYLKNEKNGLFEARSTYALAAYNMPEPFSLGEGLTGQVAKDKKIMHLSNIPENYIDVASGLGKGKAGHLLIIPLLLNKEPIGILELTSFRSFDDELIWTIRNLAKMISNLLITKIKATEAKK